MLKTSCKFFKNFVLLFNTNLIQLTFYDRKHYNEKRRKKKENWKDRTIEQLVLYSSNVLHLHKFGIFLFDSNLYFHFL